MKTLIVAAATVFTLSFFATAQAQQTSDPRCWYAFKKGVHSNCVDGMHEQKVPDGTARHAGEGDREWKERISRN